MIMLGSIIAHHQQQGQSLVVDVAFKPGGTWIADSPVAGDNAWLPAHFASFGFFTHCTAFLCDENGPKFFETLFPFQNCRFSLSLPSLTLRLLAPSIWQRTPYTWPVKA